MRLDKNTVTKIKNKDYKTIENIYSTYYKFVKYIVYKYVNNHSDADEIVQDVFMKVFTKIDSYNENYKFSNWISEVAKNTAIDFIRKNKNNYELLEDDLQILDEGTVSLHNTFNDALNTKIKSLLDDEEYQILIYRIYFDFKYKEIADIMNSTVPIVSSKYFRIINKLKKYIKKEDFYE